MSKLVVKDSFRVIGKGVVLIGEADCQPKIGPASITNPDGTYWETTLIGIEKPFSPRRASRTDPRLVGIICSAVRDGDVKTGAVVRFTPELG